MSNTIKFLGVDSTLVDLTERKDSFNNNKTEYFSIEEIKGYKVYTALLTQSGENDPVVTVLENTIGNLSFNYWGEGVYEISCNGLFVEDKTWYTTVIISSITNNIMNGEMEWRNANKIRIATYLEGALADGVLGNTPIEIRVYN